MVTGVPPAMAPGGFLTMEYADPTIGERHVLYAHVAHFDPLLFAYTGGGPKAPTEHDVPSTFAALAALWAAYYPASWTLRPIALHYSDGGAYTQVASLPPWPPASGTAGSSSTPGPSVHRIVHAHSVAGNKRRIHLRQMAGTVIETRAAVNALGGGIDARDVALLAYLSSSATGAVATDGFAFAPDASVEAQSDKPLELAPLGVGTGPYLVSG